MHEQTETPFLIFKEVDNSGRKTRIVQVYSKKRKGLLLGTIKWYGQWRQYCFWPEGGTIFNRTCLSDVQSVLAGLTKEHNRSLRG